MTLKEMLDKANQTTADIILEARLAGLSAAAAIANKTGWDYQGASRDAVIAIRNAISARYQELKATKEKP